MNTEASDKLANYILNSKNKIKLIQDLIEEKRALSTQVQDLENKMNKLEDTLKRKTEYTEKLLNKIALLYISLPDTQ